MKKLLIILIVLTFAVTSCNVKSSEFKEFDENKVVYVKDSRCDVCFAIIATRKTGDASQNGLGFTEVDCEKVEHLIEK